MSGELQALWRNLADAEAWLARGGAQYGETLYDSLGRDVANLMVATGLSAQLTRVQRVRLALSDSGPLAERMIVEALSGIDLSSIVHILIAAAKDIAFYLGGSIALGTAGGAAVGAFFGGVGAIPGAGIGAAAGAEVGGWVFAFLGLKSLAEGLMESIPHAARCYSHGVLEAWGPTARGRSDLSEGGRHGESRLAAVEIAEGHVALIVALLTAMMAYLMRGKGDRGMLLNEIRQSPRLGPKVAEWLAKNEERLRKHPKLRPHEVQQADGEAPASMAMTPKQVKEAAGKGHAGTTGAGGETGAAASPSAAGTSSSDPTVFSGHGAYFPPNGETVVPEGTSITFYSEHGATITDRLGNRIETGGDVSKVFARKFGPGDTVPNYTLQPPAGLSIQGAPTTVAIDTPLNELLKPNMGECHWAACTYNPTEPGARLTFDTTGIIDNSVKQYIKKYP